MSLCIIKMCASPKYSLVHFLSLCSRTPFLRLRAWVCFGVCESLQCVCSLLCCSVRDCRGYFIKVHLLACLRPNHPPSKSHLHQTLGILRPFLLLTLYCNSLQRGSVRQQKHVRGGDSAFSIGLILIKLSMPSLIQVSSQELLLYANPYLGYLDPLKDMDVVPRKEFQINGKDPHLAVLKQEALLGT